MKILPILGLNRVDPVDELIVEKDGSCQCQVLKNYIARGRRIRKVKGTGPYNNDIIGPRVPWLKRSYHKMGDGSFVKRTFCFINGVIYSGAETYSFGVPFTATLTSRKTGFTKSAIPLDMTIQVSGRSILYFFTGFDTPYSYNGNASFKWKKTKFSTEEEADEYESGIVHLQRAFYVRRNTSELIYSESLLPETIEDTIIVGNDKNSFIRRLVLGAGETLYIFKNNSIWQLYGRTPSEFQVRRITSKYGLAAKRGIYPVGSGFVFLDTFSKELCFFGGTEESIHSLTEDFIRLREIIDPNSLDTVDMTVHDGLFRFAFQHADSSIDKNDSELIYPINEPGPKNLPKWTLISGTNVLCYSVWNQQGDNNLLLTGRSDIGRIMYHGRSNNFDGTAINTTVRTAEVSADDGAIGRFRGFYVKGRPGSAITEATFRYFVDALYSDRGEEGLDLSGQTRDFGEAKISKQSLFRDRIVPLTEYSRGSSISFEIDDNNVNTEMEIHSITFDWIKKYIRRNKLN